MNILRSYLGCACLLLPAAGCNDRITHPRLYPHGHGGEGGGGGDAQVVHVVPPPVCNGDCCPTNPACSTTPTTYSGPECLAQFDNTNENRWQLRQTQSISTLPLGNASGPVASILAQRSQLTWPECNMNAADIGTFMQLVDFDIAAKVGRVGFAKFAPGAELATHISQGLCMVQGTYNDTPLPVNLTMGSDWPPGLPPPMLVPWNYGPTRAKGLDADFNYAAERNEILAKFAPGGEYASAGYTGLFYLDRATGYLHGYAPVAYVVTYDTETAYNAIPIRESEITAQINDPAHPNCVGVYRGDALDPGSNCVGSLTNPAWGCPGGECPIPQAPNVTKAYFLITELEQVRNSILRQTICFLDAFANTANPPAGGDCRSWPQWDPANPASGLPMGDWCAETNSDATPTCHNAFRSISYAAFQGFRVQANACTQP